MKKLILLAAVAVFGFTNVHAQDDFAEKAESGSFYVGANIGFSLINDNYYYNDNNGGDYGSFNFGFDVAYLFEVIENLEVGGLVGYTQYIAKGSYASYDNDYEDFVYVDFEDASFIPIAASARYYFGNHKFFGGLDLGVGINVAGDAKTGFYARPKFGFDLGPIALIASFQSISGGQNYNNSNGYQVYELNGFKSVNFGVEYGF
ncbi:hypothetical protein [Bizionia arctica]|uniref:Outer membrane protein beta-barrel domain-containing protein n=1 Tax=Bizionia arctica TaxID=1495645 RepID=A0A917GKN6_9FLAO|nr:hypothetical protein [Bizionia arctica]GGG50237.1 hypothetical protein GCM10010976_21780 [Bizionia arctica]